MRKGKITVGISSGNIKVMEIFDQGVSLNQFQIRRRNKKNEALSLAKFLQKNAIEFYF